MLLALHQKTQCGKRAFCRCYFYLAKHVPRFAVHLGGLFVVLQCAGRCCELFFASGYCLQAYRVMQPVCLSATFYLAVLPEQLCMGSVSNKHSRTVIGVDFDVVVTQITGPNGVAGLTAPQINADGDFTLLHHSLALLLAVGRVAPALGNDVYVVQK